MKIFIIFVILFTNYHFQDSSLFYDLSATKNLKYESRAYDFVLLKESSNDDSLNTIRIVSFNEQQEQVYFQKDDPKISIQEFMWESKLSNLYIFPIQDQVGQNYKIKLEQAEFDNLLQAIQQKKNIQDLEGDIELQKSQDLQIIFDQVFFPQKTLQDDRSLEIQMMNGIIMNRVMNILQFLSGNFDSVVQYEYTDNRFTSFHIFLHELGLQFAKDTGQGFDLNPLGNLNYIYKQQKKTYGDFNEYEIKNQYSGFQNFKNDPWVLLNLNTSQLTLGNANLIKLVDHYEIEQNGELVKDFEIEFEIDFANGFKFFTNPIDFLSSYLEKVESQYRDAIIELKQEGQEEGVLNEVQKATQNGFKDTFVPSNVLEFYFDQYCFYLSDYFRKLYEHTVLKYTAKVVPYQYYKDQYYQMFKETDKNFEQKVHPANQSLFKFNVLSQIMQFFIELQGLTPSEYFECLNQDLEEKNSTRSKCHFFMKELIQFFGSNPQNTIDIKNMKNLLFGNYDQNFEFYQKMLRQFIQGHFHLTFKKYIKKSYKVIEDNIENLITQKLSFAKNNLLI